jgi:hypothetical protein
MAVRRGPVHVDREILLIPFNAGDKRIEILAKGRSQDRFGVSPSFKKYHTDEAVSGDFLIPGKTESAQYHRPSGSPVLWVPRPSFSRTDQEFLLIEFRISGNHRKIRHELKQALINFGKIYHRDSL